MPLDRDAVKTYVNKHWLTVCDDGFFCSYMQGNVNVEQKRAELARKGKLPDPKSWQMVFLPEVDSNNFPVLNKERACFIRPNPAGKSLPLPETPPELLGKFDVVPFHPDKGLVDCAHYVSRCLTAGGVTINDPYVPTLVSKLQNGQAFTKTTKTLGQFVSKQIGDIIMGSGVMAFGDLIAYAKDNNYSHSALYMGVDQDIHRISCHTLSRKFRFFQNDSWNITDDPKFQFTLIHFDTGADVIPSQIVDLFKPVFAIEQGGKTEFVRCLANSKAEHRSKAPASSSNFGTADAGGYWFVRGPNVWVMLARARKVIRIDLAATIASAIGGGPSSIPAAVNGEGAIARRTGL